MVTSYHLYAVKEEQDSTDMGEPYTVWRVYCDGMPLATCGDYGGDTDAAGAAAMRIAVALHVCDFAWAAALSVTCYHEFHLINPLTMTCVKCGGSIGANFPNVFPNVPPGESPES